VFFLLKAKVRGQMKIAVLSPHRDDAAFSLSLAIEFWLSLGHTVTVVNCFTRSEYAPYSDVESIHSNDRRSYVTALRLREDEAWCRHYGKGLTHVDLNLKDAPLRLACTAEQVCSLPVNPSEKAFSKIRAALEPLTSHLFVLPLALGAHVDHLTARDAAISSNIMQGACAFYEDLPYAARPDVAETIADIAHTLGSLSPMFPQPEQDPLLAEQRKRRLALCYDSQIDDDVTHQIASFSRRYGGRERLWANSLWRTSALAIPDDAVQSGLFS
jgi:LmbE family N-acetylglucosaminyl deacetylase